MGQETPVVSIIILGYNGLSYIPACLNSVLNQNFPAGQYEVIWADNHSSDGSIDCIKDQYPGVRVLEFDQNYGFAEGNNKAVPYARGKYLVFLNQDTVVHKSWLANLVGTLENNMELGACQSNMFMPWMTGFEAMDTEALPAEVHYTDISPYGFVEYRSVNMDKRMWIPADFVTGASFIIRKKIVDELECLFYPPLNTYSEDLELSLRLKRLGYSLAVATRSVVYHLQFTRVNNLSRALWKAYISNRNRFWAYRKNLSSRAFWAYSPKLILGAPAKIKEFGWGKLKTLVFSILIFPIAVGGFISAIINFSKFPAQK